jgi:hypothetical protein
MREYVLTENEKTIIKKYLETGERLEGYAMLLSRCKRIQPLKEDIKLIERFLAKVDFS